VWRVASALVDGSDGGRKEARNLIDCVAVTPVVDSRECRPLPSLYNFNHVGILRTFSNISAAAAAGFDRSSQLSK
jgi:hypothetical protein